MRISKLLLALSLVGIIILSFSNTVFAQETVSASNNIGVSRIDPSSAFYFLKPIREDLEIKFAKIPREKILKQLEFATRRLREAKTLMTTTHQDLVQPTLERYWDHLQNVLNFRPRDEALTRSIRQTLALHLRVLDNMSPKANQKQARIAIRATISRISLKGDLDGPDIKFACNLLQKEASSSGLNEVEKVVLLQRIKSCLTI